MPPLAAHERFAAWILIGPVGRTVAFVIDVSVLWLRWARGRIGAAGRRRD